MSITKDEFESVLAVAVNTILGAIANSTSDITAANKSQLDIIASTISERAVKKKATAVEDSKNKLGEGDATELGQEKTKTSGFFYNKMLYFRNVYETNAEMREVYLDMKVNETDTETIRSKVVNNPELKAAASVKDPQKILSVELALQSKHVFSLIRNNKKFIADLEVEYKLKKEEFNKKSEEQKEVLKKDA